jgi:hypothetical protein
VLKRAAFIFLGVAVLSASGMPGCTLAEKQGATPASIQEAQGLPDPMLAAPAALVPSATLSATVPDARVCLLSPSSPRGRPPSLSLLSVYRI